jgi:hypothetical protein
MVKHKPSTSSAHSASVSFRANSFFTHLNRDVRTTIYEHMELGLIRTPEAREWLGFAASCRLARSETQDEGPRHLRRYLQEKRTAFATSVGSELRLTSEPQLSNATTTRLDKLTFVTSAQLEKDPTSLGASLRSLLQVSLDTIHIHFTGPKLPKNPLKTPGHAVKTMDSLLGDTFQAYRSYVNNIVITWDYRLYTNEDEYIKHTVSWLMKRLEERKLSCLLNEPSIICKLLDYDRRNPLSSVSTDLPLPPEKLLPRTLRGRSFLTDSKPPAPTRQSQTIRQLRPCKQPPVWPTVQYAIKTYNSTGMIRIQGNPETNTIFDAGTHLNPYASWHASDGTWINLFYAFNIIRLRVPL